jgi:hypothetical protein
VVPLAPHQKFFYPSFKKNENPPLSSGQLLTSHSFHCSIFHHFYHLPLFSFLALFLVPSVQQNLCGIYNAIQQLTQFSVFLLSPRSKWQQSKKSTCLNAQKLFPPKKYTANLFRALASSSLYLSTRRSILSLHPLPFN